MSISFIFVSSANKSRGIIIVFQQQPLFASVRSENLPFAFTKMFITALRSLLQSSGFVSTDFYRPSVSFGKLFLTAFGINK